MNPLTPSMGIAATLLGAMLIIAVAAATSAAEANHDDHVRHGLGGGNDTHHYVAHHNETIWDPDIYQKPHWNNHVRELRDPPVIHLEPDWHYHPGGINATTPITATLRVTEGVPDFDSYNWTNDFGKPLTKTVLMYHGSSYNTPEVREYKGAITEFEVEYVQKPGTDHGLHSLTFLVMYPGEDSIYRVWGLYRDHITREEYALQALPYDHWALPTDVMANYTGAQNKTHVWINDLYTRWQHALVSYDDQIAAYEDLRRQAAEAHAGIMLAHAGLSEAERLIGVYASDMDGQLGGTTYTDSISKHLNLTRTVPPTHP